VVPALLRPETGRNELRDSALDDTFVLFFGEVRWFAQQMQVLRLASKLIQRAKSGALEFGGFAQDDTSVFYFESCGGSGIVAPRNREQRT
jgi:hypothetical protein